MEGTPDIILSYFTVPSGETFTIPEECSMTLNGKPAVDGTLIVPDSCTLTINGTANVDGTITNNGTIINNGTIVGSGSILPENKRLSYTTTLDAPTAQYMLSTSIKLSSSACETDIQYSMDGGSSWQDSPVFSGLDPETKYTFCSRYKPNNFFIDNDQPSISSTFYTPKSRYFTIDYENETLESLADSYRMYYTFLKNTNYIRVGSSIDFMYTYNLENTETGEITEYKPQRPDKPAVGEGYSIDQSGRIYIFQGYSVSTSADPTPSKWKKGEVANGSHVSSDTKLYIIKKATETDFASLAQTVDFTLEPKAAHIQAVAASDSKTTATILILTPGNYTVVFAQYDGKRLKYCDTASISVRTLGAQTVTLNSDIKLGQGDKVMLLKGYRPICEAFTVE